ncbi:MAG: response regulator transcription factor [Pleurocapsa sp.]
MSQLQTIRILVAEDHAIVRDGICAIINQQDNFTVVAEAKDGQEAVELYREWQPDVVLMDLRMPRMEGVDAITQIVGEFSQAKIIILTTYDTDEDIYRGLKAGAKGYLLKDTSAEDLTQAICTVAAGKKYVPQGIAMKLAERITSNNELTNREMDVLQLLTKGKSNQDISSALQITEGTVKFHVNNILGKLEVGDRTQAVITAFKKGLARLE